MPALAIDSSVAHFQLLRSGEHVTFRPRGPLLAAEQDQFQDEAYNPFAQHGKKALWSARFLVGFNVKDKPWWDMDGFVGYVKAALNDLFEQYREAGIIGPGVGPGASIVAQHGFWTGKKGFVDEDGAQVFVLNLQGIPLQEFKEGMKAIAENMARDLKQETIILEFQKNGVKKDSYDAWWAE